MIGVLLMAYGTPRSPDDVLPYYTDIRRGRPPTDEQLADLVRRYAAIGGVSPLAERTEAQRDGLQRSLDAIAPGRYRVTLGLKHADPMIEAGVLELAGLGGDDGTRVEAIVGLVLAPHYSAYSVGQYLNRTRAAADPIGIPVAGLESWATLPEFVEFVAADLTRRLGEMPAATQVVFTAHSLPERIVAGGDPYADELRSTAAAVAGACGLTADRWRIGWQSAGRTPEPWIGPDILDVIDTVAAEGAEGVLVSAVGFVADHLEVLYDLDIEARVRADRAGLAFDRTACVNDDPTVLDALARRVAAIAADAADAIGGAGGR
jgi:ferrochelatase